MPLSRKKRRYVCDVALRRVERHGRRNSHGARHLFVLTGTRGTRQRSPRCTRKTVPSPDTGSVLKWTLRATASIGLFWAITQPSIVS